MDPSQSVKRNHTLTDLSYRKTNQNKEVSSTSSDIEMNSHSITDEGRSSRTNRSRSLASANSITDGSSHDKNESPTSKPLQRQPLSFANKSTNHSAMNYESSTDYIENDTRSYKLRNSNALSFRTRASDSASVKSEQVTTLEKMAHKRELMSSNEGSKRKFSSSNPPETSPAPKKFPINIVRNPSFNHSSARSSVSIDSINRGLKNTPQQQPSTFERIDEIDGRNASKTKKKRNSSSFSSSLRRLISITFNRNAQSSSPQITSKRGSTHNKDSNNNNIMNPSYTDKENSTSTNAASYKRQDNNKRSKKKRYSGQSHTSSLSQNPYITTFGSDKKNKSSNVHRLSAISQMPAVEPLGETHNSNEACSIDTSDNGKTTVKDKFVPTSSRQDISQANRIGEIDGEKYIECPLCVLPVTESSTPNLAICRHRVCLECMQRYITTEINHSRLNITCPICSELIHPNIIRDILQNEDYYLKYESFMLRRMLAAEPDARWCPAPDCGYVVLANGCASCPRLVCGRDGCNTSFCYHCKQEWHPNQTCSAASIQRNKRQANTFNTIDLIEESTQSPSNRKSSKTSQHANPLRAEDIKECPVCSSRIIKMNDGSCNHMKCSICETEFCWLCMKEIGDLHYFSPSGCTFWGKKPWSRKKKFLWQLGMLVGAPICIILIAGIAVPAIVIGIPVWAARKLHNRLERKSFSRYKKNAIITGGVLLSFIVSPIVSAVALAVGIPILLGYVYGVVPLSLCRSSSGCLSSAPSLENLQQQFQTARGAGLPANDVTSIDTALSHKLGDPSIGEQSLYMSNISLETNSIGHLTTVEREDRESASNAGLAGSIISNVADDGNSTRALAGSIISKESGYTLVPAEVHTSNQVVGNGTNNIDQSSLTVKVPVRMDRKVIGI